MFNKKVISTQHQYDHLKEVTLQPGDVIIAKMFPGHASKPTEVLIPMMQDSFIHKKSLDEKAGMQLQGSATSEHAALAISKDEIAEASGEGVVRSMALTSKRKNGWVVFRCSDKVLANGASKIAAALCKHNVNTRDKDFLYKNNITGGKYDKIGSISSLLKKRNFNSGTNQYIQDILDFVYGISKRAPNMFCSELSASVYECASVAQYGKTCFGSDPRAVTPKYLEHLVNTSSLFNLVGKVPPSPLFSHTHMAAMKYQSALKFRQSKASKTLLACMLDLIKIGTFGELLYFYEECFGFRVNPAYRDSTEPFIISGNLRAKRSGRLYNIVFKEIGTMSYFRR